MAVHSFKLLSGVELRLRQVAVEIRYSRSGLFYERFGKILTVISESHPDWFFSPDPKNGLGGSFSCISSGLDASICDNRLILSLATKPDLTSYSSDEILEFADDCDFLADLYTSNVKPTERTRIGFRQFYEAGFDTEQEANNWVQSLKLVEPSSLLETAFSAKLKELNVSFILETEQFSTRIAIETGRKEAILDRNDSPATIRSHVLSKQQDSVLLAAEKKSAWVRRRRAAFAVIDIDTFSDLPAEDVLTGEFIKNHHRTNIACFRNSIRTT
ncbi:MAG: hypothetical protein U0996_25055 [Planctomycetaceae bacterium]